MRSEGGSFDALGVAKPRTMERQREDQLSHRNKIHRDGFSPVSSNFDVLDAFDDDPLRATAHSQAALIIPYERHYSFTHRFRLQTKGPFEHVGQL